MRRMAIASVAVCGAFYGCLFPSLDELRGADASSDVNGPDVSEASAKDVVATTDATDAGGCVNTDPSLVAYYKLDEGAGTIVHDCSGNGYDGLIMSMPDGGSWATGHTGSAIHVDGTNGCVELGSPAKLTLTQAVSATAWVRVDQYASIGYVVGKTRNANIFGWRIGTDNGPDRFTFDVPVGDPDAGTFETASPQPTATWLHVAVTYAANDKMVMYVNGAQVDTTTVSGSIIDDTQATVRIGCRADTSNFFVGLIDEVRVYNRVLSASDVATLAQ